MADELPDDIVWPTSPSKPAPDLPDDIVWPSAAPQQSALAHDKANFAQAVHRGLDQYTQGLRDLQSSDAVKAIPSGLARGVSGAIGLPAEIGHGMRWLNDQARQHYGYPANPDYVAGTGEYAPGLALSPEPQDVQRRIEQVTGPLYEPQTPTGRAIGNAAEIAGGSAIPFGGASSRVARSAADLGPYLKNWLTSSVGAGTAGEAAKELGAGPVGQAAATIAGGLGAPGALKAATEPSIPNQRTIDKVRAAEAAQLENITIPNAAVAGPILKPVAGRVAAIPLIGDPVTEAAKDSLSQIKARQEQIANAYGQGSKASSGANLRDALVDYIETGSRKPIDKLYDKVDKLVDDNLMHNLPNTTNLARSLMRAQTAAERATNEAGLAPIMDDLSNPRGLTYSGIKQLRTKVGSMLNDKLLPQPASVNSVLERIYESLTDDLKYAVRRAGQPGAIDAFEKANKMNEIVSRRREQLAKIVGMRGPNTGENVFETMIQMAQDKGKSANINSLTRARKSVDPQTWNDFTSAFVRRMGIDPKSKDFSPDRFLTTYGNLSPEGKQVLFGSTGRSDLVQSLENLKAVNQQFSNLYKLGNPSGTGGVNFLTGFIHSPLSSVASVIGGRFAAKYFASPANVDKMTRALEARLNYVRTPNPGTEQRLATATEALNQSLKPYQTEEPEMLPPVSIEQASGGSVHPHAQRLNEIEASPLSPEQKRDMRRKIIEDALRNP